MRRINHFLFLETFIPPLNAGFGNRFFTFNFQKMTHCTELKMNHRGYIRDARITLHAKAHFLSPTFDFDLHVEWVRASLAKRKARAAAHFQSLQTPFDI